MGRPSIFTEKLAQKICDAIASQPRGLEHICKDDPKLPSPSIIYDWLKANPSFSESYARAREAQADLLAEQCLSIADTPQIGIIKTFKDDDKEEVREEDMLGHRRLQIDTRKWMAGKLAPKKYGDKLTLETKNDLSDMTQEELDARRAAILQRDA